MQPTPPAKNHLVFLEKIHANVFLLYAAFAVVLTLPVSLRLSSAIAGQGDAFQSLWHMWWTKKALTEPGVSFFYTDYLFYPHGQVPMIGFPILMDLVSVPFQFCFKLLTVYNLFFLLAFILSGFTMYLLALEWTRSRAAAFIAGFIYAFSPFHTSHGLGHMHLMHLEFVPLFFLFFWRALSGSPKNALWAALVLVGIALGDWYHFFYSILLACFITVFAWLENKKEPRIFIRGGWAIGGGILGAAPLVWMMVNVLLHHYFPGHTPEEYSADLVSFFVPNAIQSIGRWEPLRSFTSGLPGNPVENSNYIGYTVLVLTTFGCAGFRKRPWIFKCLCTAAVFFWILSLGMHLHVAGKTLPVPLPYAFFYKHTLMCAFSGIPERFWSMGFFCLAVTSAFGAKSLLGRLSDKRKKELVVLLVALLTLEYAALPFPTTRLPVPPIFKEIAKDERPYSIIYLPGLWNPRAMYYQTIHGKKMNGGYLPRSTADWMDFRSFPIVRNVIYGEYLTLDDRTLPPEEARPLIHAGLSAYHIRYIIKEKSTQTPTLDGYGLRKIYEDSEIEVLEP